MRIDGEWYAYPDGSIRPVVIADISGHEGIPRKIRFLLDTGADRNVLIAAVCRDLGLPTRTPASEESLSGISGRAEYVLLNAVLEFTRDDNGLARVRGEFAAFTDPDATDLSVLGRDVLDNFDVILSRRSGEVILLAPNHRYSVVAP